MPPARCAQRHHMQRERCFAARLRAKDLDNPAARNSLAAERQIQRQAARGNAFDSHALGGAQRHDGAFAKFLFDLGDRVLQIRMAIENALRSGRDVLGLFGGFRFFGHAMITFGGGDHANRSLVREEEAVNACILSAEQALDQYWVMKIFTTSGVPSHRPSECGVLAGWPAGLIA